MPEETQETEWLNITDHFVKYITDNTKKASRPGNSGSWQGILQAGKKKASYRSALEFLHYLTEYISDKKNRKIE